MAGTLSEWKIKASEAGGITILVCCVLALAPILDPYAFKVGSYEIRIIDAAVIVLTLYFLCTNRAKTNHRAKALMILAMCFIACTIISSLDTVIGRNTSVALRIAIVYFIYAFCYASISGSIVFRVFADVATVIAVAATVLLLLQYFSRGSFWDGMLPLPLSENDVFMPLIDVNTGLLRPHGFFQEVSYYALYTTPVLMYSVINERKAVSLLLVFGIILSSSFLGYVGLLLALGIVVYKVRDARGRIDWRKLVLTASALCVAFGLLFVLVETQAIPTLNSIVDEFFRRAQSVFNLSSEYSWGRSSAQMRLLGNMALFQDYGPIEKVFGMGVGEYINVFSGVETTYGSSAVNMLLAFGILGDVLLFIWAIFSIRSIKQGGKLFGVLLFIALFTDNIIFGWYFFYLMTWGEEKLPPVPLVNIEKSVDSTLTNGVNKTRFDIEKALD